MKFVHKNTGYIVVGIFLAIAIPVFYSMMESQEFFEKWSCSNIQAYLLTYDQDVDDMGFPDHDSLTEEQHKRLHEIISECNFAPPFEHNFN